MGQHTMKNMVTEMLMALLVWGGDASEVRAADDFADGFAAYKRADYATAYRLFKPLAEQGHTSAQYNIGVMFYHAQGVAKDNVEAYVWFNFAHASDHADAAKAIAILTKQMTPAQIASSQELARQ